MRKVLVFVEIQLWEFCVHVRMKITGLCQSSIFFGVCRISPQFHWASGVSFRDGLEFRSHLAPLSTVMKYSSYHPAAIDPEADSEEEEEDDSDDGCCGMREHLPHWSCCMWFFIVVIAAMLVSEVLAWLRQPSCGGHSHFEWNQVIPANTVNQIERGNLGSMLQEYDILGVLD